MEMIIYCFWAQSCKLFVPAICIIFKYCNGIRNSVHHSNHSWFYIFCFGGKKSPTFITRLLELASCLTSVHSNWVYHHTKRSSNTPLISHLLCWRAFLFDFRSHNWMTSKLALISPTTCPDSPEKQASAMSITASYILPSYKPSGNSESFPPTNFLLKTLSKWCCVTGIRYQSLKREQILCNLYLMYAKS